MLTNFCFPLLPHHNALLGTRKEKHFFKILLVLLKSKNVLLGLFQAFEEIQGLTDQADKLTGQKNLLMRKQDTLIRKVSALSGEMKLRGVTKLKITLRTRKHEESSKCECGINSSYRCVKIRL